MNSPNPNAALAAEEQASLWAARIEGSELTEADRALLDGWLAADPAHPALLARYRQFSALLDRQLPELAAQVAMAPARMPMREAPKMKLFAALAAAAALAFGFWLVRSERPETIATSAGQRRTVVLADGTRVEMNARTTLLIEKKAGERRVRLAEGEALFAVAKDLNHPFTVETPAGSVRDTGTVFDVRSEAAAQLEVTVVEGSVQVRSASGPLAAPLSLKAGDRLIADGDSASLEALSASAIADALAWRDGHVVFDGVPLPDALATFAHYHGRSITAAAGTAALRVGGRYALDDLDGFLASLEGAALPISVTRDAKGGITVNLRTKP